MRRWNHPHSLGAGILVGLLISYRPWLVFLLGVIVALAAVAIYRASKTLGRKLRHGSIPHPDHAEYSSPPEGYKFCANPTCRMPMARTRRIYCSDACKRIVRLRLQAAAADEADILDGIPY